VEEATPHTCVNRTVTDHRSYTSGSIRTADSIDYLGYGRYEARIKVPVGHGFFTAFWTLGFEGGWPGNGEVDVMEQVGQYIGSGMDRRLECFVRGTSHWLDAVGVHESSPRGTSPDLDLAEYHVYAVERTPASIRWYVDGIEYASLGIEDGVNGTEELHTHHAILFNFALGGWPPSPDASTTLPATMYVDWVRFYEYRTGG